MNSRELDQQGWPCPTADEMRGIDRDAIEVRGLPGRLLMENAGRAIAGAARERWPGLRRPLVVCGGGNNGGDGFVVARVLREQDDRIAPVVLALGERERLSPEARQNFDLLVSSGVEVVLQGGPKEIEPLLARCDLVVDAVFGVGLARPVEGELLELFRLIRASGRPLLAVDVPSGLDSDRGVPLGSALEADLIVTLGLPKLGLALAPGAPEIRVADIGLPAASRAALPVRQRAWTPRAAAARVPARPPASHKGSFGHVLVIGGSEGKTGAAVLAAEGALHAGAGLVTVAAARSLNAVFESQLVEAMSLPLEDAGTPRFGPSGVAPALEAAAARDVVVLGPGLGAAEPTVAAVRELLRALSRPAVVDADGLNAFAGEPEALAGAAPRVLTPHPGEMGRLLGRTSAEVQADRVGAVRELARRSGAVALLKGARTLVARPDGELLVNPTGGPGLATGGTGDVLSGVIGALLAQGLDPFDAAGLSAWLHGRAGERLGAVTVARAVAAELPAVLDELRASAEDAGERHVLRRFP